MQKTIYIRLLFVFVVLVFTAISQNLAFAVQAPVSILIPKGTSMITERILYNAIASAGGNGIFEIRFSEHDAYLALIGRNDAITVLGSAYTDAGVSNDLARIDIPIGKVEYIAYMRESEEKTLDSWDDVKGMSVGVSIDSHYVRSHFSNAVLASEAKSGLVQLANGEVDVYIATVYDEATPLMPKGVVAAGVLEASTMYCWYNKSQPDIGKLLVKGLESIQANGIFDRIRSNKSIAVNNPKVLLQLSSYSSDMIWQNQAEQSLHATVDDHKDNISLYLYNMNFRQTDFRTAQYEATTSYIRATFMDEYPDVIIVMDNDALAYMQENYTRLFKGVPVVFAGINGFNENMISQIAANATGIGEYIDPTATVEFALKVNPDIKRIHTIFDMTSSASPVRSSILQALEKKYGTRMQLTTSGDQTFDELIEELKGFDKNTMILIGTYFSDKDGRFVAENEFATKLCQAVNTPVYTLMSGYLGYGVVGGRVAYSKAIIAEATHMAIRILHGESPAQIPIIGDLESNAKLNAFMVDQKAADRFGIAKLSYQGRAIIINESKSIFEVYPVESALGLALMLVIIATSILCIMLMQTKRLRDVALISANTEKESNHMKSDFLARMSHEIRTPLNAILGMNELTLRENISERVREYSIIIMHSGRGLLSIINDILDFSKIEAGKMELVPANYDVGSLLYDLVSMIRVRISDKPITVEINISPDFPAYMYGDETRVRQVLLNFLTNAAKYTHEGKIILGAEFEFNSEEKTAGMAVFSIADTGIGIKEEDINKLFGAFAQVDINTNRKVEGTGLGLAIAKTLVDMMQGNISIKSEYGKGSTFTVRLFQEVRDYKPLGNVSEAFSKRLAEEGKIKDVRFVAPDIRILAVDDVDANLMVIRGLLAPYKVQVDTVSSGVDAIDALLKNDYDFVFMDHMMPGMDGVETTQKLRNLGIARLETIPIIALTANAISGMKEMLLQAGMSDFISKPIELDELDKMMHKWIPKEKRMLPDEEEQVKTSAENQDRSIRGIDLEKGLKRFGGKQQTYEKILCQFAVILPERIDELSRLYAEKRFEELGVSLHALKGVSGNVDCSEVYELCIKLETAIKNSDFTYVQEQLPFLLSVASAVSQSIGQAFDLEARVA